VDNDVELGNFYYYIITAVNEIGESSNSNEASIAYFLPASAPLDLHLSIEDGYVRLDWQPPLDNGGSAISYYIINRYSTTAEFGVEEYAQVADAYLKGLERRVADGEDDLSMASVASFFVSRVDTEVDKRLEGHEREQELRGRAGLANARAAYKRFQQIFAGERWEKLEAAGAHVQRPLWASTGVKDPAYPDTLYVDGLIGPHTVNTMPLATLLAAADHAEVDPGCATADIDPTEDLEALAAAGIDLKDVTDKLLRDGVAKFVDPMEKLLQGIEEKRQAVTTRRPSAVQAILPDDVEPKVAERVQRAHDEDVARRIWQKDATLWAPEGTPEVADRLGWLGVTEAMGGHLNDLEAFAER
jgi:hypothetical protein